MVGSAGGLAPDSGLGFLAALPPGCLPWPWDEAADGSWKKREKEWLFPRGRWGSQGQAYWTGFEELEIAEHSKVFVPCGLSANDCFSQPITLSLSSTVLFSPLGPEPLS